MKYKGHEYEIVFCDPKDVWGQHAGLFHIRCAVSDDGYYETYAGADAQAKVNIDKFLATVPQTKSEWLSAMTACMVWHGITECHLDKEMVWSLLNKAALHLKDLSDSNSKRKPFLRD